MNRDRMQQGIRTFLEGLFEGTAVDPALRDEALARTPERVAAAMASDLLAGYLEDPALAIEPVPAPGAQGPVLLSGISFASMCAHHLLPFRGVVHVGYLPGEAHAGLGGIAKLVDTLARRLTIQEALTVAIAEHLERALAPRAVLVAIEAEHTCLALRGARKEGHALRTVERRGIPCPDLDALLAGGGRA